MRMSDTLPVSVIITTHNSEAYIERCLDAVLASAPREVIVVDDASTDTSPAIVRRFPVQLIRNPRNLGPTRTRNIGAHQATADYLLFLDSDIAVESDYVRTLASFLMSHSAAGVVSGTIVESSTNTRMFWNYGYDPNPLRDYIALILHSYILNHQQNKRLRKILTTIARPFTLSFTKEAARQVDWVMEGASMTRRTLFERLNGFDEKFWMFYEGPDYCRRVRNAGHYVWYIPQAMATHLGGHSHTTELRRGHFDDAKILYYTKHGSNWLGIYVTKWHLRRKYRSREDGKRTLR
jgi:N-acetylglucosaminyl-diphospho-decaprenol L-rhamnosyltransferase